jgi:hypothetical protein
VFSTYLLFLSWLWYSDVVSIAAWDVDFATTAYRQHVEALTQKQVMYYLSYLIFVYINTMHDRLTCCKFLQLLQDQERQAREAAMELQENNDNMR